MTDKQKEYVRKHFAQMGATAIAKVLGLKRETVSWNAHRMGLEISAEAMHRIKSQACKERNSVAAMHTPEAQAKMRAALRRRTRNTDFLTRTERHVISHGKRVNKEDDYADIDCFHIHEYGL